MHVNALKILSLTLLLRPGPDISPCLEGKKMPALPTNTFASLTTFSLNWPAANSGEVNQTLPWSHYLTLALIAATCELTLFDPLPEEMRMANLSRERLWELLSPAGPDWGSDWGSNWGSDWGPWQRSYHCFLHEEGADAATRGRASLFQLWTTQVGNCFCSPAPRFSHMKKNKKQTRPPLPP